jgi:AcrR family transcriptional regulator
MPAANALKEDVIQEQILQAAQLLFQKHGFQKITMDDIAKAIGKGRSSLYYYYKSKDEVFDAVMDAEIREIFAELNRAVEEKVTVEQKIHAFCLAKISVARKRHAFFEAMETGMNADEMSQYAQKKHAIHQRIIKEESILLRQVIIRGSKKGEWSIPDRKDLGTVIFVLLSSLRGLKREMMLENDFSRLEPAVNILTAMTLRGIKK